MILPKQHLESAKIFEGLHPSQFQPAGIDITLKEAYSFKDAGLIDFDNSERKISGVEPIPYQSDKIHLDPGAYKVIFNEYVRVPKNVAGICLPRSSLLRCGATLECAVWDPGYEGRSEALLVVRNPHGIILKKSAKIGQMVFIRLVEDASSLYEGQYKGENK
ncbi:deoxyuridine 5'-triphosphate nucleotidohydrolase [Candidatus Micrarchaeota archaeon]|nr:deoxyuridine 5'-triphosphate nucleotidohydrolase [Candidatus Micrarchaeota archaeon]MBU1166472.1 deoxyuridine 5'-triphosphate nucleotidohydrolase [Candidatus Micrarchaeota archaeon]MBU1886178.1 deoxyuridine 5'-triphosphate nucleotidohydrolase [Candidatus Micrarchaeota archaeon]